MDPWYWYKQTSGTWLRCKLINKLGPLMELEVILSHPDFFGRRVSGKARKIGGNAWIVDE
jgi:hypothetical protein